MDTTNIHNSAEELKGQIEHKSEDLKDTVKEGIDTLDDSFHSKGGEVKGRADQWAEDHKLETNEAKKEDATASHSIITDDQGFDQNPLEMEE